MDSAGFWIQAKKINPVVAGLDDDFGWSVDISGDNAIVGAPKEDEDEFNGNTLDLAGSAEIYKRDSVGNWNFLQKLVASDRAQSDYFGYSVSYFN